MVDTSNRSNLYGELRIYVKEIERAAQDAPAVVSAPVLRACADVIAALEGVTQARADAARTFADQRYSVQYRLDQANGGMTAALNAATAAKDALTAAADKARATLEASFLPGKPAGVEENTVLDRKADLTAILAGTPGDQVAKIAAVAQMLATALQSKDALTAYVLTQRMVFIYQAQGLRDEHVKRAFAQALGAVTDASGQPRAGGALLANLQSAGPNTIAGVIAAANIEVYQQQQAYQGWVRTVVDRGLLPDALPQR